MQRRTSGLEVLASSRTWLSCVGLGLMLCRDVQLGGPARTFSTSSV